MIGRGDEGSALRVERDELAALMSLFDIGREERTVDSGNDSAGEEEPDRKDGNHEDNEGDRSEHQKLRRYGAVTPAAPV